jgi:hypothetical protein
VVHIKQFHLNKVLPIIKIKNNAEHTCLEPELKLFLTKVSMMKKIGFIALIPSEAFQVDLVVIFHPFCLINARQVVDQVPVL